MNPNKQKKTIFGLSVAAFVSMAAALVLLAPLSSLMPYSLIGIAAFTVCCGIFTFLYSRAAKSPILAIVFAAVSYALAFLYTKSLVNSLLSILFVPAALILSTLFSGRKNLTDAVSYAATFVSVSLAGYIAYKLYSAYGTITLDTVKQALSPFISAADELLGYYEELAGIDIGSIFTPQMKETLVDTMISILPGLVCICATVSVFVAEGAALLICRAAKKDLPEKESLRVSPSVISAAVFLVSLAISFFFTTDTLSSVAILTSNLYLILAPCFFFVGMAREIAYLKAPKKSVTSIISIVLMCIIFFINFMYFILLVAMLGAVGTITDAMTKKIKPKY